MNVRISSDALSAEISPLGAELKRPTDRDGRELLWRGDPAWWSFTAPILFPIVGGLAGDRYRVDGRDYDLPKHGFARRRRFETVSATDAAATLRLTADAETRAHYPFDFRLDLSFAIDGAQLSIVAEVANEGVAAMPASFGFHPAFAWPLPYGRPRAAHRLRFAAPEPAPIRRIDQRGLLTDTPHPTPVDGDTLILRDALFEDDAIIFDRLRSRRLVYGAPGVPALAIAWDALPQLGVWTKPGAPFVCIEPWQGHADPVGYDGDFRAKPGVIAVAPGKTRRFAMRVEAIDSF